MELEGRTPRAERKKAWAPVEIQPTDKSRRLVILHDASATGLLLGARAKPELGEVVSVHLPLEGKTSRTEAVPARVVRVDPFSPESHWPWTFGVRFEDPIDDVVDRLCARKPERAET